MINSSGDHSDNPIDVDGETVVSQMIEWSGQDESASSQLASPSPHLLLGQETQETMMQASSSLTMLSQHARNLFPNQQQLAA